MGQGSRVKGWYQVKNQTLLLSYFASGWRASYLSDNLFERCGKPYEQATKRPPADYADFR
jgi:hypothetical protein